MKDLIEEVKLIFSFFNASITTHLIGLEKRVGWGNYFFMLGSKVHLTVYGPAPKKLYTTKC
jgi:hypothetical protein